LPHRSCGWYSRAFSDISALLKKIMREIEVINHEASEHDEWIVEDADSDGEGNTSVAIFYGPYAEQRAKRFAERLKTNTD